MTTVNTTASTVEGTQRTEELNASLRDSAKVEQWARERAATQAAQRQFGQTLEDNRQYNEAGPFYAGNAPLAGSAGFEVGVVTRNKDTGKVQRTGLGLYVRSDHLAKVQYNCSDF